MGSSTRVCKVDGCGRFVAAWDMCSKHYYAARRAGLITGRSEVCKVGACRRPAMVRGYCSGHYKRLVDSGTVGDTPLVEQIRGRGCKVKGCERRHHRWGFCQVHGQHVEKHGAPKPVRKMGKRGEGSIKDGYRFIHRPDHPNSWQSSGLIAEHRFVMSESLGRPLLETEEVHHKNGDRLDNRLVKGHELHCPTQCCNLELWSHSQPPGQRVRDKIEWARWILKTYAPDHEA